VTNNEWAERMLVIPVLYLMAGICLCAGCNHLTVGMRRPRDVTQLLFAGVCFLAAPYSFFLALSLRAVNAGDFIWAVKGNLAVVSLLYLLFNWLIAFYTGKRPIFLLWLLSVAFAIVFIADLAEPLSLQYDRLDHIYTLNLPWGEAVTRGFGHAGFWAYSSIALSIVTYSYLIYALMVKYRRDRHLADLAMLLAFGFQFACTAESILVRLSMLDFIELGPLGVLVMVVVMSASFTFDTQLRLFDSEERLRAIIDQSPIGMAFSREGVTVDVNSAYRQMFGFDRAAQLRGQRVIEHIAPQCRDDVEDRIQRRMQGLPTAPTYETVGLRKDGSQFPLSITSKRIKVKEGPLTTAFLTDITERKKSEAAINHLAFFDHLTDLPNRRLFVDRLQQALAVGARSGKEGALLFIDLDHFKTLNDTRGHEVGDLLLQLAAQRLRHCLRAGDTVARLGGDEFVIMLDGMNDNALQMAEQIDIVSDKIVATLREPYSLAGHDYAITCSIGATLFKGAKHSAEELLKQADIAMYQAKKDGRNTMRFFDPNMQEIINNRASLEKQMRAAILEHQFQLYYQVQVDEARNPVGAEALIRWIHPERGMVSPLQFIPLAEETGLILSIGQWVLETACAQIKRWEQDSNACNLELAINISAKQIFQSDFFQQVQDAVQRHAINPSLLKLELTESTLLENIDGIIETMQALKAIGIKFSLDDFGTGYSSLQYTKQLPIEQLKIDQSFVRDIAANDSDKAIVRTIIAMAHSLYLDVIAEGVETEEQYQLLLKYGCLRYQGYLFGKPLPIDQFATLIATLERV
jgi:diguanylate cyclase (GGDEF)-like protein/PAS domain S-box-containing protein